MGDQEMKHNNNIYFLAMEKNQPQWYLPLAEILQQFAIALIPIDIEAIKKFPPNECPHIIISESTLSDQRKFNKKLADHLKISLRNGHLSIYHVSSFAIRPEFIELRRKKRYYLYKMPLSVTSLCSHVLQEFLQNDKKENIWPGGRRVRVTLERPSHKMI